MTQNRNLSQIVHSGARNQNREFDRVLTDREGILKIDIQSHAAKYAFGSGSKI
jgi:hypothetical protein